MHTNLLNKIIHEHLLLLQKNEIAHLTQKRTNINNNHNVSDITVSVLKTKQSIEPSI